MALEHLHIIHFGKVEPSQLAMLANDSAFENIFFKVETCQRTLWVGMRSDSHLDEFGLPEIDGMEEYFGAHAYAWLLQLACGLHSAVLGETEVFGQLKTLWQQFETSGRPLVAELRPIIQRLFSDAKEIRAAHLQGLGGASYGSLARKLLDPKEQQRVVLMGAGQLAQAVIPYFSHCQLSLWNRSKDRLQELVAIAANAVLLSDDEIAAALASCDILVICTPVDAAREQQWISMLNERAATPRVLHLGGNNKQTQHWTAVAGFLNLDDAFSLRSDLNQLRDLRVERAKHACADRAQARLLMDAIVMNHGWEDLAHFS